MVFFALEKVALSRGATICRLGQIEGVFLKKITPNGTYPPKDLFSSCTKYPNYDTYWIISFHRIHPRVWS